MEGTTSHPSIDVAAERPRPGPPRGKALAAILIAGAMLAMMLMWTVADSL